MHPYWTRRCGGKPAWAKLRDMDGKLDSDECACAFGGMKYLAITLLSHHNHKTLQYIQCYYILVLIYNLDCHAIIQSCCMNENTNVFRNSSSSQSICSMDSMQSSPSVVTSSTASLPEIFDSVLKEAARLHATTLSTRTPASTPTHSSQPPLNLLTTTPKNFTKFVAKCGPLFALQDKIEAIITWENRSGKDKLIKTS